MTREEFGAAYQRDFRLTIRFLKSNGLSADAAQEIAQAAWARGWERLSQLRDARTMLMWINRVALNIHRSLMRREPAASARMAQSCFKEPGEAVELNLAAIDIASILGRCKAHERRVLRDYYIRGLRLAEIARRNGWNENTARVRLFRARQSARMNAMPSGERREILGLAKKTGLAENGVLARRGARAKAADLALS